MKSVFFVVATLLVFSSCSSQNNSLQNINASEFEKGIKQGNIQLVDVRTPSEFDDKHIAGALNININDAMFESMMKQLDKSKPTYIYCLAGSRSKKAAEWAVKNGFVRVYNLEGGITSWIGDNKPVVDKQNLIKTPLSGMSFDDYLSHLKASPKLVLVDFNAVWCGPCKMLKPVLREVEKKYGDKMEVFAIDVDENPTVANTMNVQGIPMLVLYMEGKEVWRTVGLTDESTIAEKVKQFSK
jgi:thioredoxin